MKMKYLLITLLLFLSSYSWTSKQPLISIITSVYKGEQFIKGFMEDIVQQTIFDQCELIMINANSPENEELVIKKYMEIYPNICYIKLDNDPGLYAVWNIGIKQAQAEIVTNANLDDRLAFDCYGIHLKALVENLDVDLVYSDFYETVFPNETFANNRHRRCSHLAQYSWPALKKSCLPNSHPMWRKSMHEKFGYFDETFKSAGDWEMWLRAGAQGAKFLKVPGVYGLYFRNPKGLSTNRSPLIRKEVKEIISRYAKIK